MWEAQGWEYMRTRGGGGDFIVFFGVFSVMSPLPCEVRTAECGERLIFVGFFFLLLMGNQFFLLSAQQRQGKKKVSAKCCDFRKAEIKVLCGLSKPLWPGNKRARGFSLGKVYSVIFHATRFILEAKVWVRFGLI